MRIKFYYIHPIFSLWLVTMPSFADSETNVIADPCAGPGALLAILDRPTIGDSACVVKPGVALLEMGYTYQKTTGPNANTLTTVPQAEFRLGLIKNLELIALLPNYMLQKNTPANAPHTTVSGYSDLGIGVKYEFGYTKHWLFTADAIINYPSGSDNFSKQGMGITVNSITAYSITSQLGLSLQLGISSQTAPIETGAVIRYTSFNPDLTFTYQFNDKSQIFVELNDTTNAGPGEGNQSFIYGGFQYLITPKFEVDIEVGHRLNPEANSSVNSIGFGVGIQF